MYFKILDNYGLWLIFHFHFHVCHFMDMEWSIDNIFISQCGMFCTQCLKDLWGTITEHKDFF